MGGLPSYIIFLLSVGIKSLGREYAEYLCVGVLLPMGWFFLGVHLVVVGISLLNNGYIKSEMA